MDASLRFGGGNALYVYADSPEPNKQIAGDILHYMGTLEGQRAWTNVVGAADGPIFPEALEGADLDPIALRALQMFNEQIRVGPSPLVRNPDVVQVTLELQPVTPNLAETVQGLYTGQLTDIRASLQDLNDRAEAELGGVEAQAAGGEGGRVLGAAGEEAPEGENEQGARRHGSLVFPSGAESVSRMGVPFAADHPDVMIEFGTAAERWAALR